MEAIILAGGMGIRLKPVIENIPKCMAPVAGKPFLYYLLSTLESSGFRHIILSLGYKYEIIESWLKEYKTSIPITLVAEDIPLGTGGGVKFAMSKATQSCVFVLNGDSYIGLDYQNLYKFHKEKQALATIALKQMFRFDRYGKVEINDESRIVGFGEKQYCDAGFINAGVYVINRNALEKFSDKFSLEKDFFVPEASTGRLAGFQTNGYFIDIGIPEDYFRVQNDFSNGIPESDF